MANPDEVAEPPCTPTPGFSSVNENGVKAPPAPASAFSRRSSPFRSGLGREYTKGWWARVPRGENRGAAAPPGVGVAARVAGAAAREVRLRALPFLRDARLGVGEQTLAAKAAGTSTSHVKDLGPSFKGIIYLNDYHAQYFGDLFTSISMG